MNNETFEKLLVSLEGLTGEQRDLVSGRVKVLAEHADTTRLAVERLGNPASSHTAPTRGSSGLAASEGNSGCAASPAVGRSPR